MRPRWLAPVVATGGLLAAVVLGAVVPPAAQQPAQGSEVPLEGISLVCPQPSEVAQATATADAVALAEVDAPAGLGSVGLSELAGADSAASPVDVTEQRGVTVSAPVTSASLLAAGAGSLAPGTTAEVTTTAAGDRTTGLGSTPCAAPAREWWFLAGDGAVGRRSTLVLGNAASGAAVVDVEIWTEAGPVPASGTNDLGVPALGTRVVPIDAAAPGSERLAVHVTATTGKIGAAVVLREVDGADPIGLSWVGPSEPPATRAVIPALPAVEERTLRLLNPGDQDAIASVRVLGTGEPFTPLGLDALDVPAGQVVDVDLSPVGDEDAALEVTSNRPVVAAARATDTADLRDFAVLGTTPGLSGPAATRVTSADGRSTRLLVTVLPDPEAAPASTPAATASPAPSRTPRPTATASPTGTAAPTATAQRSPEDTPEPTPTGDDVPRLPPVTVTVTLLGLDGASLGDPQRVRVRPGATVDVPVTLPDGVTDAWVQVQPPQDTGVLVTRETRATVQAPDPLDPDVSREATWFDLLTLRSSPVTVSVPAVVPDVTVGLPGYSSSPE